MKTRIVVLISAALWCYSNILEAQTASAGKTVNAAISFQSFDAPQGIDMTRAATLAEALDFKNWPATQTLFAMPEINTSMLEDPAAVTQTSHSCTEIPFDKTLWNNCSWSWRRMTESKDISTTTLPAELRDQILNSLSEEQRKDPQLVNAHLKRQLQRYQKTQRYRLAGQMDIEICLTPGDRAAKEFLLAKMTDNMLPTEILGTTYKTVKQPEGLGTISFTSQSRGDDQQFFFVRNNIFVSIRAKGSFVDSALPLAQKIDNDITAQPSSTLKEIQKQNMTE